MKIDIIGRGKLSWLAEEILWKGGHELTFFDDTMPEYRGTLESQADQVFISIGNTAYREKLFNFYYDRDIISVISDLSSVSHRSVIARGAFVNNFCSIHTHVMLGLGCFVHPNTVIDVGVTVGNFVRFGSQCYIGEGAKIGNNCVIGSGVTILPGVQIGDNCHVCAGSVVNRSFGSDETIVGYPARSVKGNNELHTRG